MTKGSEAAYQELLDELQKLDIKKNWTSSMRWLIIQPL